MTPFSHKKMLIILAILILITSLTACSINESEQVSLGAIKVIAYDSTQAVEIIGATVVLDGVTRNETTPAVLTKVTSGSHTLEIRPDPSSYSAKSLTVSVTPPDTSDLTINFALVQEPAIVTFTTNMDPVSVILNDDFVLNKTTQDTITVAPGSYGFSVYKEGFKTVLPSIENIDLTFNQEVNLTFTLEAAEYGNQVGDLFPEFYFPTDIMISETERDSLGIAQHRGRVVLVNFWGYTCDPCREEFPAIEALYTERAIDGFRVLAINANLQPQDAIENFASFREEVQIPTVPLLLNTAGIEFYISIAGQSALPRNFLVDQSGIIRYSFGATNHEELSGYVSDLLD